MATFYLIGYATVDATDLDAARRKFSHYAAASAAGGDTSCSTVDGENLDVVVGSAVPEKAKHDLAMLVDELKSQ